MQQENPKTILRLTNVGVAYDGHWAIEKVNLEIRKGELVSLIGPNGAGKTTLLKAIAGILPIKEGQLELLLDAKPRAIGYIPQQLPIDRTVPLSVLEFLALKIRSRRFWFGLGTSREKETAQKQLEEVGAAHLKDRKMGELSGGEFQRVMIAYGLLGNPELLLLDEPLTGVDVKGGLSFEGILHHLHDHRKMTIIMVSHDLHLVSHLSTTVCCVNRTIHCVGTPQEVLQEQTLAQAYGSKWADIPFVKPSAMKDKLIQIRHN